MREAIKNYSFISGNSRRLLFWNKIPSVWLMNKRKADNVEGLWRIHDNLYDVTDFISRHPGGRFWLEQTKGTDVTEAFESHHLKSDKPQKLLEKFYVKKAKHPRLSHYTFKDDGFYRTLKRKLPAILEKLPSKNTKSCLCIDLLLITTFILSILANAFVWYPLVILSGLFGAFTLIAAHNFVHQADNLRMYVSDIFFIPAKIMRLYHIFSHHMYTNTIIDLQLLFGQPIVNFFPTKKSKFTKYIAWMYLPTIIWPFHLHYLKLLSSIDYIVTRKLSLEYVIPLLLPLTMHVFGGHSLLSTILTWQLIIIHASFCFYVIAYTSTHIHTDVYMQGDTIRPNEFDWGINQLDTVTDRIETKGHRFLCFILLGDHALHHLFPTLDQWLLDDLYPLVEDTLKDFNLSCIRMKTQDDLIKGFVKRIVTDKPNLNPPILR